MMTTTNTCFERMTTMTNLIDLFQSRRFINLMTPPHHHITCLSVIFPHFSIYNSRPGAAARAATVLVLVILFVSSDLIAGFVAARGWKTVPVSSSPQTPSSIHHSLSPLFSQPSSSSSSTSHISVASETYLKSSAMISPFSASDLRRIVTDAASPYSSSFSSSLMPSSSSLDLVGLVWMEHINLVVGPGQLGKQQARHFYIDLLGCSADKSKSFHVNLGQQQFHLKEATVISSSSSPPDSSDTNNDQDTYPQTICGSIGIAVPDLKALYQRLRAELENPNSILEGTMFQILDHTTVEPSNSGSAGGTLTVRCPWGNVFHCYQVEDGSVGESTPVVSEQKMTRMHSVGGEYGSDRMAVRTQPGIRFIEIVVPPNALNGIERFYNQVLKCSTRLATTSDEFPPTLLVSVGPGVDLVFVPYRGGTSTASTDVDIDDTSISTLLEAALEKMRGVHICVYTQDFRGLYDRLSSMGLVWTNPRFVHLDTCDTWEEAHMSRTLRFRYIIDPTRTMDSSSVLPSSAAVGMPLLELEHETRPMRHGQYMKVPFYEPR